MSRLQSRLERLRDVPSATVILDRFLHQAEIISIAGPSYRLKDRASNSNTKEDKAQKDKDDNYFAWGNSGRCFNYIHDWVGRKVRRHLMRSRQRKGFG